MIPLFKVFMPETVMEPLSKTLLSGFIGQGQKVEEFEAGLKSWFDHQHLATVNSGTSALHLALKLNGVGPGDEVITTPLTCFATNAPIIHTGADLIWADVDQNCNIDLDDVVRKITPK